MRAAAILALLIAAVSVLSSVQGLDYFTGMSAKCDLGAFKMHDKLLDSVWRVPHL